MKGASSASGAAAATAASQVQPVVGLHGRIHDLFSPITAASCADKEEYEKLAETKTRTDKIEVLPKGYSNDDTKAKSTAMSRLLAVDSDNYMLRKGATSANGAVASTSTVPAIVPAASISNASSIAQNLQLHPRQIHHHHVIFTQNSVLTAMELTVISKPALRSRQKLVPARLKLCLLTILLHHRNHSILKEVPRCFCLSDIPPLISNKSTPLIMPLPRRPPFAPSLL